MDLASLLPVLIDDLLARAGSNSPQAVDAQAVVDNTLGLARRIDAGSDVLNAFVAFESSTTVLDIKQSKLAGRLHDVAVLAATYERGMGAFQGSPVSPVALRDTVLLYSARAFAVSAPADASVKPLTIVNSVTRVVATAESLDSSLRVARASAGDARTAQFVSMTARYNAYVRLIAAAMDDSPSGALEARLDTLLSPIVEVLAGAATGNVRVAFSELSRMRATWRTSDGEFDSPTYWRALSFAVDIAEAQDAQSAEDAINRFVGQGAGIQRKKASTREWLIQINAYAGAVAGGQPSAGGMYGGFFLPIGLEIGHSGGRSWLPYHGLTLFPVDLGAIAALRWSKGDTTKAVKLGQIFTPGVAFSGSLSDWPLSIGPVLQYRGWADASHRWMLGFFAAVDVPLFP